MTPRNLSTEIYNLQLESTSGFIGAITCRFGSGGCINDLKTQVGIKTTPLVASSSDQAHQKLIVWAILPQRVIMTNRNRFIGFGSDRSFIWGGAYIAHLISIGDHLA